MITFTTPIWLSPNRIKGAFEVFDEKITFLSERLVQADSDKNFYRNTRMRAIALSIAVIATAILTSYLSFTIGLPALVSWAISPAFTPGVAIGLSIGTFALTVLGGYALKYYLDYLEFRFSDITASQQSDQCTLQFWKDGNKGLVLLFEEKFALYSMALQEDYSNDAFGSMCILDPTIPDLGEDGKQSYWNANKKRFQKIKNKFDEFCDTDLYKESRELVSEDTIFFNPVFGS